MLKAKPIPENGSDGAEGAETVQETVEIDATALKAISDSVVAGLTPVIEAKASDAVNKAIESKEGTINKAIGGADKAKANVTVTSSIDDMPKEIRFLRTVKALNDNNREELKAFNQRSLDLREKAGYANAGTDADGGYVVLDPEFEAEVEKLMPNYGVALRDARIVPISSDSIKTNKRGSNVSMYEVLTEGGQKRGTKLTISQVIVTLREFAAIAVATNRLIEDEAIDFWQMVTEGFAEERARIIDQMVFSDTNATYPGIIHTPGVAVEPVGAAITDIKWDDLMNAETRIPEAARANMKHYMHRSVFTVLMQNKGSDGHYLFQPVGSLTTPWGTPIVLSDSLPSTSSVPDANEGYVVTGDLKRASVYMKRGLVLERSNEATVHDADGNEINLWERNMQALKAEMRAVVLVKFPEAFCVIGTGTVS